ncbi:uncharacterized protein LOC112494749 [Cephus cinctus]|uniref:Uncharacterized protein LOC112494749 n=1 Tax=Cephus cinctus TaxID=211228 RepID=A0AAJ7RM84_CEPCN|nr:uncharacterized protein LOC112494749 [Cephus cinctus]
MFLPSSSSLFFITSKKMANDSDNDFKMDYSMELTERAHDDVIVVSAARDHPSPLPRAVAQPGPGPGPRPQPQRMTEYPPADEERNYQRRGNRAGRRARQNYA